MERGKDEWNNIMAHVIAAVHCKVSVGCVLVLMTAAKSVTGA